ncbi:hypothetical protein IWW50_003483 [Coemansia erecta]|nr:hypothetical protein IWW50_003483 [Coemansia erecta]
MTFVKDIELLLSSASAKSPAIIRSEVSNHGSLEAILGIRCSSDDSSNNSPVLSAEHSSESPVTSNSAGCIDSLLANTLPKESNSALNESFLESIFSPPANRIQSVNDGTFAVDGQLPNASSYGQGAAGPAQKIQPFTVQYTEKEKRERKYECKHCKKRFSRPSSLTSHVYTHTGERPFACDYPGCTKRFSVLSNLRRHHKVHTNRRNPRRGSRVRGMPLTGAVVAGGCAGYPAGLAPPSSLLLPAHTPYARHPEHRMPATYDWNAHIPIAPTPALQRDGAYPTSMDYHAHQQLGHVSSVRTTAPVPPLQPHSSILDAAAGSTLSQGLQGMPLLSTIASSGTLLSPCPAPMSLGTIGTIGATTTNGLSPEFQQSLSLSDATLPNSYSSNADVNLEAIFGSGGDSDSSSSSNSSDNSRAAGSWPLPLGQTRLPFAGMARDVGDNPGTGTLPGLPAIAAPAILTNSSVTTKAMSGRIEPHRNTAHDVEALLSLSQPKVSLAGMVQTDTSETSKTLLDSLGGGCGSARADSAADSMWQFLQSGYPRMP